MQSKRKVIIDPNNHTERVVGCTRPSSVWSELMKCECGNNIYKRKPHEQKETKPYDLDERIALFKYFLMQSIYSTDDGNIPEDIIRAFVSKIIVHESSFDWYLRFLPETPPETLKISGNRQKSAKVSPPCDMLRRLLLTLSNSFIKGIQ